MRDFCRCGQYLVSITWYDGRCFTTKLIGVGEIGPWDQMVNRNYRSHLREQRDSEFRMGPYSNQRKLFTSVSKGKSIQWEVEVTKQTQLSIS